MQEDNDQEVEVEEENEDDNRSTTSSSNQRNDNNRENYYSSYVIKNYWLFGNGAFSIYLYIVAFAVFYLHRIVGGASVGRTLQARII